MIVTITPSEPKGTVKAPSSKSMAHRLMICAGIANGTSHIEGIEPSKDMEATIECLKALGAQINQKDGITAITGTDPKTRKNNTTFPCNESGSTLRFFIPLAALSDAEATFTGRGRLMERPMAPYANLFAQQGLKFVQDGTIQIQGPLQSGLISMPGDVSSQFISGLLFAATQMEGITLLNILPPYESKSYVDLTVQALKQFGADIKNEYEIIPASLKAQDCVVEGDYSQAAFFLVAGAVKGNVIVTNLKEDSLQGDKVIVDILKKAGAQIEEQTDHIQAKKSPLNGQVIDLADCPDLGPILCVLAAFSEGTTTIKNAGRLRLKESDRIEAMETELKKAGVDIRTTEDTITIEGKKEYRSATFNGHNDHRIVMAITIFAVCAGTECTIEGAEAITKSYPAFFEDLEKLGIGVNEQ